MHVCLYADVFARAYLHANVVFAVFCVCCVDVRACVLWCVCVSQCFCIGSLRFVAASICVLICIFVLFMYVFALCVCLYMRTWV